MGALGNAWPGTRPPPPSAPPARHLGPHSAQDAVTTCAVSPPPDVLTACGHHAWQPRMLGGKGGEDGACPHSRPTSLPAPLLSRRGASVSATRTARPSSGRPHWGAPFTLTVPSGRARVLPSRHPHSGPDCHHRHVLCGSGVTGLDQALLPGSVCGWRGLVTVPGARGLGWLGPRGGHPTTRLPWPCDTGSHTARRPHAECD